MGLNMSIDCSFADPPEVMDTITMAPEIRLHETGLTMVHLSSGMEIGQELEFPHELHWDNETKTKEGDSPAEPVEHTMLSILLLLYVVRKIHNRIVM